MEVESEVGHRGEVAVIHHVLEVEQGACTGVRMGVGEQDHEWQL